VSYYAVFAFEDDDKAPVESDTLGTGLGWLAWGDHVLENHEQYPECAHLAQEGWADDWDALEHEAEQLTHEKDGNIAAVSANLLGAVRGRPAGAGCIAVTDGTEPDGEGDDDGDE
jgi:hypothetical protein